MISISVILPTYNENESVSKIVRSISTELALMDYEIIVVDDDSPDGTSDTVLSMSKDDSRIRLIRRVGRAGLGSAIKEGILCANREIVAVMDSDGQHKADALICAARQIDTKCADIIIGSRFVENASIKGLGEFRKQGSIRAHDLARKSLSRSYAHLSDYMSGFFVFRKSKIMPFIRQVDVNGFKILFEILLVSNGKLLAREIPLSFSERDGGSSKFNVAIFWDYFVSLISAFSFGVIPRRMIGFAIVNGFGILIQVFTAHIMLRFFLISFTQALVVAVFLASCSNYLINNYLTFSFYKLKGYKLLKGFLKYMLVISLPCMANISLASFAYSTMHQNELFSQILGILLAFTWNYLASSKFVWNAAIK